MKVRSFIVAGVLALGAVGIAAPIAAFAAAAKPKVEKCDKEHKVCKDGDKNPDCKPENCTPKTP